MIMLIVIHPFISLMFAVTLRKILFYKMFHDLSHFYRMKLIILLPH